MSQDRKGKLKLEVFYIHKLSLSIISYSDTPLKFKILNNLEFSEDTIITKWGNEFQKGIYLRHYEELEANSDG